LNKNQQLFLLVIFGVFSEIYYFAWWFEFNRLNHPLLFILFVLAVIYCIVQILFVWYIYLHSKRPDQFKPPSELEVDVFIPTYDEPIELVERTLTAVLAIRYPHQTYLIDDGHRAECHELAKRLGVCYLSRSDNTDQKAGNVNYALAHSTGEFIAIFDVDHIPAPDFLDRSLGPFRDPEVGFVQVMLSHYNQTESFVAAAAAQRNDGFFGPVMLGLQGCDCVQMFGSNCIFRRQALESIGGYQSGLAEDLNTSVHLHAKGWRSYYIPEVLAEGLEPADLLSFLKQQFKWSLGIFTILWRIYPRLANRLNLKMNICYLWRLTCYLAGPAIALHIIVTILILFQGSETYTAHFVSYLKHSLPFVIIFLFINYFVQKNYRITVVSPGFRLGGILLAYGIWPVYTLSFLFSLLGIEVSFMATPKEAKGGNFIKLAFIQIVTVILMILGIVLRVIHGVDFATIGVIAFAFLQILLHSGIFYAVYEGWRMRRYETINILNPRFDSEIEGSITR
jgi:cellulose synthase (UDP-forming)